MTGSVQRSPEIIEVWAPLAEQVEIEWSSGAPSTDGSPQPQQRDAMTPSGDGWWRWGLGPDAGGDATAADDRATASGPLVLDYAFVLDGQEPALPDPRSAWQPHGVHGPSRTFDPATFDWTDGEWNGPRRGCPRA